MKKFIVAILCCFSVSAYSDDEDVIEERFNKTLQTIENSKFIYDGDYILEKKIFLLLSSSSEFISDLIVARSSSYSMETTIINLEQMNTEPPIEIMLDARSTREEFDYILSEVFLCNSEILISNSFLSGPKSLENSTLINRLVDDLKKLIARAIKNNERLKKIKKEVTSIINFYSKKSQKEKDNTVKPNKKPVKSFY